MNNDQLLSKRNKKRNKALNYLFMLSDPKINDEIQSALIDIIYGNDNNNSKPKKRFVMENSDNNQKEIPVMNNAVKNWKTDIT